MTDYCQVLVDSLNHVRCGLPELAEAHDPLGDSRHRHPFDPTPDPEDHVTGCTNCVGGAWDDGLMPAGWIYAAGMPGVEPWPYDAEVERTDGARTRAVRCRCNPTPTETP